MRLRLILCLIATAIVTLMPLVPSAHAAIPAGDFSLEVSPSPLVATVKPGTTTELELRVRNASRQREELKIEARGFSIAHPAETIRITTSTPPDLASWVHFSSPTFAVDSGAWFTQKVSIALPQAAGFSYPFVVVISRANEQPVVNGGQLIEGAIGVFALINVDKPGATRKLEVESFKSEQGIYEYLPSTLKVTLKNTGNSIVQPYGNIYVQRGSKDATPLAVLPVNDAGSYILPDNSKEFTANWNSGYPAYVTSNPDSNGKTTRSLDWGLHPGSEFRIGRYTAKLIAVYNDGTRDVPIIAEVSFWVIPWRILLGVLVVVLLVGFALWSIFRKIIRKLRRKPHDQHTA